MKQSPCLDCLVRTEACCGFCDKFNEWREEVKKAQVFLSISDADRLLIEGCNRSRHAGRENKSYGKRLKGEQR